MGYSQGQGYSQAAAPAAPTGGPSSPPPSFDSYSSMSEAARSLKIEMDAEMAKEKKDYQRLKDLKSQMDAQTGLDADRMGLMAEIKAAEGREDYDRCADLQRQLDNFPKSVSAGGGAPQLYNSYGYNNGMSRARRTRGVPAYGYGQYLGYRTTSPYRWYSGYGLYGGYNPYTGYNMYNPYNYGLGFNRWYDPSYSSYYGVGGYWGGIPWRGGSMGYGGYGWGGYGWGGGYYGYGYPW